jgi:hypothetical protein
MLCWAQRQARWLSPAVDQQRAEGLATQRRKRRRCLTRHSGGRRTGHSGGVAYGTSGNGKHLPLPVRFDAFDDVDPVHDFSPASGILADGRKDSK